MKKKFTRVIEDFICEACGTHNIGNGFTNHCSECLVSKHVDIYPGDRLQDCHGLMYVTSVTHKKSEILLEFTCQKCKAKKNDHVREGSDNFLKLLEITKSINNKI